MAVPTRLFQRFGNWDETVGRRGDERGTFEDTVQDRIRRRAGLVLPCCGCASSSPRETLTPRQISSAAFTRGRNEPWMRYLPIWGEVKPVPRRKSAAGLLLLAGNLLSWGFGVMVFRLIQNRSCFERARRAAFASGCAFEWLRAGRNSMHLYRTTSRFVFFLRRLMPRLTPDTP